MRLTIAIFCTLALTEMAAARNVFPAGDSVYTLIWEDKGLRLGEIGQVDLLVTRFPTISDEEFVLSGGFEMATRLRGTEEQSPLAHEIEHLGGDRYRIKGLYMHVPGIWDIKLSYHIGTERFTVLHSVSLAPRPGADATVVAAQ